MAKVLIIGGGGREHSIAIHLSLSSKVSEIYVIPGNAGTKNVHKCTNVNFSLENFNEIGIWCINNNIRLVVVGPEDPLISGLCDILRQRGILCFGPSAAAARLEGSKHFAKVVMAECGIATAEYATFTDVNLALSFLNSSSEKMRIIKVDGIAAGKGVIVSKSLAEAKDVVVEILDEKNPKFGTESLKIIIEEELIGFEISILAFTDGVNVRCFPPCQDHKRIFEGDNGPNTGGMGAYCPCDLINEDMVRLIEVNIIQKIVDYMRNIDIPYQGILYAGLMITEEGPRVLEFNCRFGDPETQVLLPLLKSDLFDVMMGCSNFDGIKDLKIDFHENRYAMCIVLTSGGYPGSFVKGLPIEGLNRTTPMVDVIHAGTIINEETSQTLTNGGRVLSVVAVSDELQFCYNLSMDAVSHITFKDCFYRKDIGFKSLNCSAKSLTYAKSGVNISAGEELVKYIKSIVGITNRTGVVSEIGQFGAIFDLKQCGYKDPLLISGTDGVGTKLKIALMMNKHDTIGQDLVAMCVNDILCHGAEPLFFLDYYASGKLELTTAKSIVSGIINACHMAGCSLIGGETAEMPGMYQDADYDMAGFVIGAVERSDLLPNLDSIITGDCVIGLASSGLHSNGFSFVRKIISLVDLNSSHPFGDSCIGSYLLNPTTIYVKPVLKLLKEKMYRSEIRSLCHITGGGITGNLPRSLPQNVTAVLDANSWPIPPIFSWLWNQSGRNLEDFTKTFNLGIGFTLVVSGGSAHDICQYLVSECGISSSIIGYIKTREHKTDHQVILRGLEESLNKTNEIPCLPIINQIKRRVGVLISGSGTNLQALLKYARLNPDCSYQIVIVISNIDNVKGLDIARMYGVPSMVINHKLFPDRKHFDDELDKVLSSPDINCQLICLSGFMRILGKDITKKWHGRMLNIHPSLLPSFRGARAHREVLRSGVRVTGATVHFVVEEVDSGGIIAQEAIEVLRTDSEESLSERVKVMVEHGLYPRTLDKVAKGDCFLDADNKVEWID